MRRPRRAGPSVASIPTTTMTTAVMGSSARPDDPSISPSLATSSSSAERNADHHAGRELQGCLCENAAQQLLRICAHCGADADLLAALRYGERHHCVDAGRR